MSSEKYPFKKRKDVRLAASLDEAETKKAKMTKTPPKEASPQKLKGSARNRPVGRGKTKKWVPPKSPYKLIQEELADDPWRLLVASIFLKKKTGSEDGQEAFVWKFFEKWGSAESTSEASLDELTEFLQPMGLNKNSAFTLIRFSKEYLHNNWIDPKELYGIGKYGSDSYKIFFTGDWKSVKPSEYMLCFYYDWLKTNHKALGLS